jgi:hypothetical protein
MRPKHIANNLADEVLGDTEHISESLLAVSSRCPETANLTHVILAELSSGVALTPKIPRRSEPMLVGAMSNLVTLVVPVGIPPQVLDTVVRWIPVIVTSFRANGAWAYKGFKHDTVNLEVLLGLASVKSHLAIAPIKTVTHLPPSICLVSPDAFEVTVIVPLAVGEVLSPASPQGTVGTNTVAWIPHEAQRSVDDASLLIVCEGLAAARIVFRHGSAPLSRVVLGLGEC